ncbi:MAG TPA: NAD(P)-dependent oxidoreductase [Chloroflexota bacterium]
MAQKVGFIGIGAMGRPFATNIVKAGFDLIVYDLDPEPIAALVKLGAKAAKSPREVAEYADIVDIAVREEENAVADKRDGPEPPVEMVLHGPDGLLAGGHPGLTVVIHTSMHPTKMEAIAAEIKSHGIDVLDAQMSGGTQGVESKTLCIMCGGDRSTLEKVRPVLETTGGNIFLLGGMGMGAVTKILQNTMTAEHLLAASEGFRLAAAAGVDVEVFQEVVQTSAASSHVADVFLHGRGQQDASWAYYPILRNALDLAHKYDITLPGAATAMQALAHSLRKPR